MPVCCNLRVEFRHALAGVAGFFHEFVGWDDGDLAFAVNHHRASVAAVLLQCGEESLVQRTLGEQVHRVAAGWWKGLGVHTVRLKSARTFSNAVSSSTSISVAVPWAMTRGLSTSFACSVQVSTTGR